MSAYALTNDYAGGAAHFVRRGSQRFRTFQSVARRSFFGSSVTRFLGTVRAEVLGTTLTPEGGES